MQLFGHEKTKLPIIQALRGLAALAVAWGHLTYGLPEFEKTALGASGRQGYLGVYIFFVISGFIVPYAMFHGGYKLGNFWQFLKKRIVRVEPPYLLSIAISLGIWWASGFSSLYQGGAPQVTWTQLALHVGYMIPFTDYPWISGVYWSLAVEFQYYLVLSLMLPLFISRRASVRIPACLLFAAICLVWRPHHSLPELAPVFMVGIAAMLYMVGVSSRKELALVAGLCAAMAYKSLWFEAVAVTVATLLCILFIKSAPAVLLFVGDISYSLYLLHDMVGRRVVHIGAHFVPTRLAFVLPFLAMAAAIVLAWAMFRLVELPAKRIAGRLKYQKADAREKSSGMTLISTTTT